MNPKTQEVIYQIDADDRLIVFNSQWNRFATDNDSPYLTQEHITNQSLWDFIHDAETRHLHQALLKKVRQKGFRLTLTFRCDSPALRRFMEMNISPLGNDNVKYRCRCLWIEQRVAVPLLCANAAHSDNPRLLRMCSWCKKIDVGNNTWLEVEDAIRHLRLFDTSKLPQITHGVCHACLRQMEVDD